MPTPRISASSYSNTAPLVWSFLYGREHGKVELILDNAPARSAELLAQNRVDVALVPVIAAQVIDDLNIVSGVCVGARERVRSVSIVTRGMELADARSVALDISSKTSVVLTKIIFREFLGFDPVWKDARPDMDTMLAGADAALIIGDPALAIAECGAKPKSKIQNLRSFDLAEIWKHHTGLGFIFAMWMTKRDAISIDFAAARDEGLAHIDEIAQNYSSDTGLDRYAMKEYLTGNIAYAPDESMLGGMELYFKLATVNGLIDGERPLRFI